MVGDWVGLNEAPGEVGSVVDGTLAISWDGRLLAGDMIGGRLGADVTGVKFGVKVSVGAVDLVVDVVMVGSAVG